MTQQTTKQYDNGNMLLFRSTMVDDGETKKGEPKTIVKVYLDPEQVEALIQELGTRKNERGAKMSLHIVDKEANGRSFKSTFAFIDPVQEAPGGSRGGFGKAKSPAVTSAATTDAINKLRQSK